MVRQGGDKELNLRGSQSGQPHTFDRAATSNIYIHLVTHITIEYQNTEYTRIPAGWISHTSASEEPGKSLLSCTVVLLHDLYSY